MGKAARFCKKFLGLLEQQANPIRYARKIGVRIGEGCRISGRTNWGSEPWLITIGNHTALSFDCTFITHDGATWGFRGKPGYENIVRFGRISVGDDCFIGAKATILPGVHIGTGSIIAAGAVVASSVPAGAVWGGVPAKRLMATRDYAEKCKSWRVKYGDASQKENETFREMTERVCDAQEAYDAEHERNASE